MAKLPSPAKEAWENRERRIVLTTVSQDNVPNSIWLLCAYLLDDDTLLIANNSMNKTLQNIETGCKATLLYIAPERESYQLKGTVENHSNGPYYDEMKQRINPNYPGRSAIVFRIEEVYYGAEKLV